MPLAFCIDDVKNESIFSFKCARSHDAAVRTINGNATIKSVIIFILQVSRGLMLDFGLRNRISSGLCIYLTHTLTNMTVAFLVEQYILILSNKDIRNYTNTETLTMFRAVQSICRRTQRQPMAPQ